MNPSLPVERRHNRRLPETGSVRLCLAGPLGEPFIGTLVDSSSNGFRSRHDCPFLTSGQLVYFKFGRRKGTARVVWTRIMGNQVESGFTILK